MSLQLSVTLYVELTTNMVKLMRRRGVNARTVYIPMHIVRAGMDRDVTLGETKQEKTIYTLEGWRVTVSEFKEKLYISYIKLDDDGDRI